MKIGNISTLAFAFVLCFVSVALLRQLSGTPPEQEAVPGLKALGNTTALPDFNGIANMREKKSAFFDFLRPIVADINHNNLQKRALVESVLASIKAGKALSAEQSEQLSALGAEFKVDETDPEKLAERLLRRIDVVPESLVLVQAATESGWGSSRFAREGLNLFGQWCYTKGCGLVPSARRQDMSHEVTVFDSVEEAMLSYINNLNTHPAYQLFRAIRAEQRAKGQHPTAPELAYGLVNYSERREAYVDELLQMLQHNKKYLDV
ncbi:glucosaminidase domain-containing protein [Shewanella jiangmenensis]|uniref:glucosaminidase domain-containing protein n=1 Tax=Shewanella jiangmenensis TaxID=2837387 RepID=UPI00203238B0|nr:glucosaminidase domain-containing protein [Shewanella jiangmenensis]